MFRIAICDKRPVVTAGLQYLTDSETKASIHVLSLEQFFQVRVDVLFLSENMLEEPLKQFADLIQTHPGIPIVLITDGSDPLLEKQMFNLGASACLSLQNTHTQFKAALDEIRKGGIYFTEEQKRLFAQQFVGISNQALSHEKLTKREYQLMILLAEGHSAKEISDTLRISKNTISNHRSNILKKMNLGNTVQLTRFAMEHHLIH